MNTTTHCLPDASGEPSTAVAIVGLSGRFPGADGIDTFWRRLREGTDCVQDLSEEELLAAGVDRQTLQDPNYVRATAMLDGFDLFDAEFFGISAREAQLMDPQQRLFLECAWAALEHAGYRPRNHPGTIGLYAGTSVSTYLFQNLLANPQAVATMGVRQLVIGNDKDFLCGRVAYELNLRGPVVTVATACSTSLVAVHMACQSLLAGECDMALAGGVTISSLTRSGYFYAEGGLNAREGRCRAFDADASGIITGNGLGIVVLKPLAAALRDGDTVHAVIRGTAINNDGQGKMSFTAPSVQGQAQVIAEALAVADVDPGSIAYVEAHGTGTLVGDPVEVGALTQAYGGRRVGGAHCALGSVKTNMGHLDTAAGVAGLIKAALAVREGEIPPSLHFDRPNPMIRFDDSPFYVNTTLRAWPAGDTPRRAAVSSFGIGGTNAHAVLEQAPAAPPAAPGSRQHLLPVSARNRTALAQACERLAEHLESHPGLALADVAHTLASGREAFGWRGSVVAADAAEAAARLRRAAADTAGPLPAARQVEAVPVVWLFPGGGTPHTGMGRGLYEHEPVYRAVIDDCAARLLPMIGDDIRALMYPSAGGPPADTTWLDDTARVLPALFATEVALAAQLRHWGVQPQAMIGHSLGECVAAHLAGVMSLPDALKVVAARGRLLATRAPANMVAVLASAERLQPYLQPGLWLACVNSRESCTLGGEPPATESLARRLAADGIEFQLLRNWPASHTGMMDPIADEFRAVLASVALHPPRIPYISNLTGHWIEDAQATDPQYWADHLRHTVQFADGLQTLLAMPDWVAMEVGPGQTLLNLLRRDMPAARRGDGLPLLPRRDSDDCAQAVALQAVGQLWARGGVPDWQALSGPQPRRRVPLPTYPFQRQRYWIDAPAAGATAGWVPDRGDLSDANGGAQAAVHAGADLGTLERPANMPYEAPRGELETILAQIWENVLGVAPIGRDEDFFALGGSSLIAVQLGCRIRTALGVEVPLRTLFKSTTVAAQADVIVSHRAAAGRATAVDTIPRRAPGEAVPATPAQQRLLFLQQLDTAAGQAYHISKGIRITGRLPVPVLANTLDTLMERHESLRTRFVPAEGGVQQRFGPPDSGFPLQVIDLSPLDAAQRQRAIKDHVEAESRQPFALQDGPMVRARLLQLAPEEQVLLLTQHHIISDGWSLGVLVRELGALIEAALGGREAALAPLPVQFGDYALWQQRALDTGARAALIHYWKEQLAGAPALLSLPTDRPRPATPSWRGAHYPFALDPVLSDALRALARRHGLTLFNVLLTGWALLLSRWAGQDDLVIGSPVANRPRAELEGLVGFFVNTLALRVRTGGEPRVAELLAQVQASTLAAFEHQALPFDLVVDAVQPPRSTSHGPLFQAMINVHDTPADSRLEVAGLGFEPVETLEDRVQCDLVLSVQAGHGQVTGTLNYAVDLFDEATIGRMSDCLAHLFAAMAADDTQPISHLPLLPEAQRRQVLHSFNDTARTYPREALVHLLFERQAAARPDAPAVVQGGQVCSYAGLDARANRLAQFLVRRGVAPSHRVALDLPRSTDLVVAMLAVLKTGACYVPLDAQAPPERRRLMREDCGATVLLSRSDLQPEPDALCLDDLAEAIAACPAAPPEAAGCASDAACIFYTSGSTGTPKGVVVGHRQVLQLVIGNHFAPLDPADCVAFAANPAFDATTWEVFGPLLAGARLLVVPQPVLLDEQALCTELQRGGVTAMFMTVALLNQCIEALRPVLPQLRVLMFGGEKIDLGHITRTAHGVQRPHRLLHVYGPTETTTFATAHEVADQEATSLPIGAPIGNSRVYILDAQRQPVPVGVIGEIYIGGQGVTAGYLGRPDLNAECFVADPWAAERGARMYRSGDLGRWTATGEVDYIGRNDQQVKIRGLRIELGEIETRLLALPGVRQAAVLAREDSPGDKRLVAYLVGEALDAERLRERLRPLLPGYMVPAAFVLLGELPLNANGKLDRKALPAPQAMQAERRITAPQGPTEEVLAALWQELLGAAQVDRHDNFFDLGGHSLLASRLVVRLRERFGVELPLLEVFQAPDLASLASAVVQAELARYADDDIRALMDEVTRLDDDEIARLMQESGEAITGSSSLTECAGAT